MYKEGTLTHGNLPNESNGYENVTIEKDDDGRDWRGEGKVMIRKIWSKRE